MVLKTNKAVTLTGSSTINNSQVVYLSATLSTENEGNTNITQNIVDQVAYQENKTECRKDIQEFQNLVYEVEDELAEEK